MKNTVFIEYDNSRLENLSQKIYNLFVENNYNTTILNNNISINEKNSLISNSTKPFVLSNKINNDDANAIEIIYPLKSNDNVAKLLNDRLSNIVTVTKYYQLRASSNTKLDYYEILRNTNSEAIIIRYGNNIINNENLPLIIFQAINDYLNDSNTYTVQSGDSLYQIARKFNTTVDEIKKINNLSTNNLSIGQKLIIPANNIPNENNNQNIYTVQSGDSLYQIARKFNTTVDEIKKINNLSTNNLSIGQKLIIPTNNIPNENNNQNIYTVQSGDSLYQIARKFNTTVDEIKKINNLSTNNLYIGQKLIIPANNSTNQNTYTVQSGDSLYQIARKFNTTVNELKRINNLTTNNLSIGQKLVIP